MYVCGSTGEGFLLDTEERMLVAETVVNEVGKDMNIIVHVGCPDTRHSCILATHAEKISAAATSAVPCVYYRPSEESVYQHWTKITEAAELQEIVTPLIYRLCSFPSMHGAVKGIITLDGCPMGDPRLPFLPVSTEDPKLIELYHDIRKAVEETKEW